MEQNQMNNYSFLSKIKSHVNSSVVLIVCTILALLCANMPWTSSWYNSLWQNEVSLSIGRFNLFSHGGHPMTLMQVINDFLMAIFFLSVGLEIKREILVGELSSLKKALLPIIGACGGMIVPVVIYALLAHGNPIAHRGLAIPMATDIAFSLGVLAIFKTRVPVGLKVFLAALAVADDLGGIIVIALFYTSGINWIFFTLAVICILVMVIANWRKVRSKAFYLIVGLVLWYMMLNSGIHATIAGVIVAFCVPSTLKNGTGHYLERIRNNISKFPVIDIDNQHNTVVLTHDQIHILKSIESAADKLISPLQDLEDNLQGLINWFVIPLFAFANAGVVLKGMAPGELFSGVSLAVMLGLIVGKFVGVFSFSWISVKLKLVSLPQGADWKSFASVCVLCGIGFTVSMFIADLSFSPLGQDGVQYLNQAKFGILSGSLIAALLGAFLLGRNLPKEDNQN
ncbi:MAG: Na+/H+ antiporter NhaA [Bacteroidales bacterium]|nr:Na+/H+ antiporter NhaA [Bacteroidales bacterium]